VSRHFFAGTLIAICSVLNCRSETVYDNGPPYRPPSALATGYEMSSASITAGMTVVFAADDFTLATSARIDAVVFYDLENGDGFTGSIVWRIYSNASEAPGTLLYTGTVNGVSHISTGFIAGNYSEYVNSFTLPAISLPPGTYWLALHSGPMTNNTSHIYWEKADGAGARPSETEFETLFLGLWFTNSAPDAPTAELLFTLTGVPAPRVTAVSRLSGHPQISFTTTPNESYRVEYADSLPASSWTPLPGAESIAGTGGIVQVTDPSQNLASVRSRFYRAVLL
jgi:hypothetical protein